MRDRVLRTENGTPTGNRSIIEPNLGYAIGNNITIKQCIQYTEKQCIRYTNIIEEFNDIIYNQRLQI